MRSQTNEKRNILKLARDFKIKQGFQTKSRKRNLLWEFWLKTE